MTFLVILVSDRTTMAWTSLTSGSSSASGIFLLQHGHFEFRPLLQKRDAFGRNRVTNQYIHKMVAQCKLFKCESVKSIR